MPGIFKRFVNVAADKYVFPAAEDLTVSSPEPEAAALPVFDGEEELEEADASRPTPEPEPEKEPSAVDFAQIQAEAILADARREAQSILEKAVEEAQAKKGGDFSRAELEQLRKIANEDGYNMGFSQGLAEGRRQAQTELEEKAAAQEQEIQTFLKEAVRARDEILDESKEGLKELALAIAEKVIRISLKSSGGVLVRMIESATAKRRRCEWVQVYIADCDARAAAETIPELTQALSRLSERVRIIPMADDESGTCIIEMPDEIIDASVSTQLDNLRDIVSNADVSANSWPLLRGQAHV